MRHLALLCAAALSFAHASLAFAADSICLNSNGSLVDLGIPDGQDLGFRYQVDDLSKPGRCVNREGKEGLNPGCMGPCGNLRGMNFAKFPLKFMNFAGADFTGANLQGTNFYCAQLHGARFWFANLQGASFHGTQLQAADFRRARMRKAVFADAHAQHASFIDADMQEVWWAETYFNRADFRGTDLRNPWEIMFMENMWRYAKYDARTRFPHGEGSAWGEAEGMIRVDPPTPLALTPGETPIDWAKEKADGILRQIGVSLPEVIVGPGDHAYSQGDKIYIGNGLIEKVSPVLLAQILLHEAGHVHEGHTGIESAVIQKLYESGFISHDEYVALQHSDEHVADIYAAFGAWMLDPNPSWPAFSQWLAENGSPPTDTHPGSLERAANVALLTQGLYSLERAGFFEGYGWEGHGHESGDDPDHGGGGDPDDGDEGGGGDGGGDGGEGGGGDR